MVINLEAADTPKTHEIYILQVMNESARRRPEVLASRSFKVAASLFNWLGRLDRIDQIELPV